MPDQLLIAIVAAIPGCLAAVLAYLGRRSVRKSIGIPGAIPLIEIVKRQDSKLEKLVEGQTDIRERLARIEGQLGFPFRSRQRSGG